MGNISEHYQMNLNELSFKKLIEHSYTGVTLFDRDLKVVYSNPAAKKIAGWCDIDYTRHTLTSLIHPDDEEQLQTLLTRLYAQSDETISSKFRIQHHTGYYIWIEGTFNNLLNEQGIHAFVLNFAAITQEVEENVDGKEHSLQMEELLDTITDGFFVADLEQRYLYVNEQLAKMVGMRPEDMIGRRIWDLFPDAIGSITYNTIQQAMAENRYICTEDYYAPLGLWQENRVYPRADGFSMFIQDITSRKKADEQLRLLFDLSPDMIGIMGADRHFKTVNPAMCILLEYTEKELLATDLDRLLHPDDVEVSRNRTREFISGGDQTMYFENRFLTKHGKPIWLSWTVTRSTSENVMYCVGKNISEKKEMEKLLEKANQLARIGGWEVDRVNTTAYWSPITRQIYEVPDDFVPSIDNWLSFYREGADRDYIAGKMAGTIATGEPCDAEVELITAKGNTCWVRAIAEAEFKDGFCVRVYGSFQDIDSRKKAELAATAALEERNKILDSIGDGFFAVDTNWIVTYWNATAEQILNIPREEILGKCLWDIYGDVRELDFYKYYQQAVNTGQAVHFEDYYPPMQIWFGVHAYPSENGLSVFFRDITEAKRSETALKESEKRYSDLFHLSPESMFVYDLETLKYLDVNAAAIKHYGYSKKEFLSMTILDIRPEEDVPLLQKTITEKQSEEKVKLHGVFRHRKKNGEIIEVDIQSNLINYNGVKAKVVLANDVSERVRYIEAIEAQNKKLSDISWMQSHIIRAPLSRIMGLIQMMTPCVEDDAEQQLIHEYIITAANELDDVIRSITETTTVFNLKGN